MQYSANGQRLLKSFSNGRSTNTTVRGWQNFLVDWFIGSFIVISNLVEFFRMMMIRLLAISRQNLWTIWSVFRSRNSKSCHCVMTLMNQQKSEFQIGNVSPGWTELLSNVICWQYLVEHIKMLQLDLEIIGFWSACFTLSRVLMSKHCFMLFHLIGKGAVLFSVGLVL